MYREMCCDGLKREIATMQPLGGVGKLRVVCVVCVVFAFMTGAVEATPGPRIAEVHVREATQLIEQGEWDEAERIVDRALEFDERSSDAYALGARVARRDQERTREAIEWYELAIELDEFSQVSRIGTLVELAELYLRTERPHLAAETAEEARYHRPRSADALIVAARAAAAGGERAEAEWLVEQGMQRFPEDARFHRVAMELDPQVGYEDRRRLETNEQPDDSEYLRTLLTYAELAPSKSEQARAVDRYFELGGTDPLAWVVRPIDDEAEHLERFFDHGGDEDIILLRRMADRVSEEGRNRVLEQIREADGAVVGDRTRDGYAEEKIRVEGGEIVAWHIDRNTDGVPEYEVELQDARPVRIVDRSGDSELRIEYRRYPEVGAVEMDRGSDVVRYRILPRRLAHPVLDREAEGWPPDPDALLYPWSLRAEPARLSPEDVPPLASHRELRERDTDRIYAWEDLIAGMPSERREDRHRDGMIDYLVLYEAGLPSQALRDVTGDGRFDAVEDYTTGRLFQIRYDRDGDGVYDYIETLDEPRTQEWDYDGDGQIDAMQTDLGSGRVRILFSSGRDGILDLSIDRLRGPLPAAPLREGGSRGRQSEPEE